MSKAFRTPEILRLFALKQPEQLRERLATLTRDRRLGKVADAAHDAEAVEILTALKKLGGELSEVRRFDPRVTFSHTSAEPRARFHPRPDADAPTRAFRASLVPSRARRDTLTRHRRRLRRRRRRLSCAIT